MKELTFNEINNKPKYCIGTIAGAYLFDKYALVKIEDIEVTKKSPYDLEKEKKSAHTCCGITQIDINLNNISYVTRLGRLKEKGVLDVGLEEVEKRVNNLEEQKNHLATTLDSIRELV